MVCCMVKFLQLSATILKNPIHAMALDSTARCAAIGVSQAVTEAGDARAVSENELNVMWKC